MATKKTTNSKKASGASHACDSEVDHDELGCGEVCLMCLEVIVEVSKKAEGHDAIFCDGASCQVWYHRWCAGVTKRRHELLAASEVPFLCPTCVAQVKFVFQYFIGLPAHLLYHLKNYFILAVF